MHIVNALAPIILLISLGAILRRAGFLKPSFFKDINPLIFWVALPCLLFSKTATTEMRLGESLMISLMMIIATLAAAVLGYAAAFTLRLPGSSVGAFVQGAFRGNYIYVGLPVILYGLAGVDCPIEGGYEALVFLALAPLVPLNNVGAVVVLLAGQGTARTKGAATGKVLLGVITNPVILSIGAGLLWSLSGLGVPIFLDRTLDLVGQIALPLALISTGASLTFSEARGDLATAAAATAIKVGITPLLGWGVSLLLGLSGSAMKVGVLLTACPTAVISFVMAEQLGADHRLAGSIVMLSTIASMISLAIVLALI